MKGKYQFTLSIFRMFVLSMFVLISAALIVFGSQVYSNIAKTMDDNSALRTAVGYMSNNEREFGASFEENNGIITFRTQLDNEPYLRRVYYYEGYLMESLLPKDYDFEIGDGEQIVQLDNMSLQTQGKQVKITFTEGKNSITKTLVED